MDNTIQNYPWGSVKSMTELFGYANEAKEPMAELWMGAHPKASSKVTTFYARRGLGG